MLSLSFSQKKYIYNLEKKRKKKTSVHLLKTILLNFIDLSIFL